VTRRTGSTVRAAPRVEPRTLAPPARRTADVVAVERLGAYHLIRALDHEGPQSPQPGQFYMLSTVERWGGGADERPYLPRAFSYARIQNGELSFLLEVVGPGTRRLAELGEGEGLALVGPLGVGWRAPTEGRRPLLVGGGIGVAPLVCLAETLEDAAPSVLLGFRSAAYAEAAALFVGAPAIATDDGSRGRQGLVTDLLREELDRDPAASVFACGPPAMLEAVRRHCSELAVPAQLALESGMACGFGGCFGCVVPTTEGYIRLCVDGPVLDAEQLETALFPGAGH
jgi:dihydroorotate dehydrogenase electron transfer subunit